MFSHHCLFTFIVPIMSSAPLLKQNSIIIEKCERKKKLNKQKISLSFHQNHAITLEEKFYVSFLYLPPSRGWKNLKSFFFVEIWHEIFALLCTMRRKFWFSLSRNVSFISSASSRPKIISKKYEYCQLPAIPVIINCDQLLVATWQHHPLESHAIDSNDLVRKFPDTWGVPMSRPVMKEHFITQITQKDDGKSLI